MDEVILNDLKCVTLNIRQRTKGWSGIRMDTVKVNHLCSV